ncbi:MAG: hypothetical protein JW801_12610 [Bacteroidales bacterium]|nr:hypothetical protein [Bacteroidales bacterium]
MLLLLCFSSKAQYELSNYEIERPPYEYKLLGTGARAAGMGYAFNAVADDATSIYWNAGGTAYIKDPQFLMSGRMQTDYLSRSDFRNMNSSMKYYPDFVGMIYPIDLLKKTLSFGAAYQNSITREARYNGGGNLGQLEMEYRNNSTINVLMLSVGYALSGNLFIGGAYSHWFSLGREMSGYHYMNNINEGYQRLSVLSGSSVYRGDNFSLGLLTDFTTKGIPLRFGIKYESPFKLQADFYQVDSVHYVFDYDSAVSCIELWDGVRTYNMPWKLSLGLSYRLSDYLTLALDYDIKPFRNARYEWNGLHRIDYPHLQLDSSYSEEFYLTEANGNLNQVRAGMEFVLHPRDLLIPLRLGFKSNRTSLGNYRSDGAEPSIVRAMSFNCGLGWVMEGFSVDFAYELYAYIRNMEYGMENRIYSFYTLSGILNL